MNTYPGPNTTGMSPGGPYHLGLRSTGQPVSVDSIDLYAGSSNIRHHGLIPTSDPMLLQEITSALRSPDRIQPEGDAIGAMVSMNGDLHMPRTDSDPFKRCVYEVTSPIDLNASVMGYLKFQRNAWASFKPDWCWLDGMAGIFFGLRHGQYNTGCYTFLRSQAGVGGLVVAGPVAELQHHRLLQEEFPFDWVSAAQGESLHLWILFNTTGYPDGVVDPPNVPTVDVWATSDSGVGGRIARIPASAFGRYPGQEEEPYATLFFGNAGQSGDELVVQDWGLYPDFRMVSYGGHARYGHDLKILPNLPSTYRAFSSNIPPTEVQAGRWFFSSDPGSVAPNLTKEYQPGKKSAPLAMVINKETELGHVAFEIDAPELEERQEGFLIEAFISGQPVNMAGKSYAAGLEVNDGDRVFRTVMVNDVLVRTYGVTQIGVSTEIEGYKTPNLEIDFTSLKLVKMIYDRPRNKLMLYVDDEKRLDLDVINGDVALEDRKPTDIEIPYSQPNNTRPAARVGHLLDLKTTGKVSVAIMNFMNRYASYESQDNLLPSAAKNPIPFDPVGDPALIQTQMLETEAGLPVLSITKANFAAYGTRARYFKEYPFSRTRGAFLEFRARVAYYTNREGDSLAPKTDTGAGIAIHYGDSKLHVGFYHAGMSGRVLGILPGGSGSKTDILEQTELGISHSVPIDWMDWHTYRVHVVPYDRIEVWVDSIVPDPSIVIPWDSNFFTLPTEHNTSIGLSFGHQSADEGSRTEWEYVRWGTSKGYDIGFTQDFPNGPKWHQFDGRAMTLVDFNDGSP